MPSSPFLGGGSGNLRLTARLPTTHPLPSLAVYALPLVATALGCNCCATLALVFGAALVRAALGFAALNAPPGYILETISASHYVETTRWALDRLGVAYFEAESVGAVGVLLFQRQVPTLHVPASQTRVSDSPAVLDFLYARHLRDGGAEFLQPILRAEDVALEAMVQRFGFVVRKWAYYHLLEGSPDTELLLRIWGVHQPLVPRWQVVLMRVLHPLARIFVTNQLKISLQSKNRALVFMQEVFSAVDARLADGRRYLLGDDVGFSRVDILMATFTGVLLRPEEFGGGRIAPQSRISFVDLPADARRELQGLASRPVGRHCLRMFREERGHATSSDVIRDE